MCLFETVRNFVNKWWYGAEMLSKAWRDVNWDSKSRLESRLRNLTLSNPNIGHLRILLHGPVGAGKSTFINSICSVFQHQISNKAKAAPSSSTSCTKIYKGYEIKCSPSGALPITIFDFMGLEETEQNVHPDDFRNALHGHLPDGYKMRMGSLFSLVPLKVSSYSPQGVFPCLRRPRLAQHGQIFTDLHAHFTRLSFDFDNPLPLNDPRYIWNPSEGEKTHCLVCVVSADSISRMTDTAIEQMKMVLEEASELGIPGAVIMTMCDLACPAVKNDLKKIYKSKTIKMKIEECSNKLQVPITCIFPVKNYHEEIKTNNDMDILLLMALKQIVHFAKDYAEDLGVK